MTLLQSFLTVIIGLAMIGISFCLLCSSLAIFIGDKWYHRLLGLILTIILSTFIFWFFTNHPHFLEDGWDVRPVRIVQLNLQMGV